MGCDIHIRIERFDEGKWVRVPYAVQPWHTREADEDVRDTTFLREDWAIHDVYISAGAVSMPDVFDARNYRWFNLLAGVRGDGLDPIAAERGLPDGTAYEDNAHEDNGWLGDHSFTWVSLEELEAYPWDNFFCKSLSAREMSSDWPGQVLPILRAISHGKPLRLVIGFDS